MKWLISSLMIFMALPAYACSCKGIDIRQSLKNYPQVFIARVVSVKMNGSGDKYLRNVVADIQILDSIKGNQKKLKRLYTGFGGGDCGITLNAGWQYIFFTDGQEVHACSGSGFYPGKDNDDGFVQVLRDYMKSGKEFDPKDFFFIGSSDSACSS
ncbi:MAG TPA: hypothetical protein PK129_05810 [Cellvibrionaceae bacterium]|nr:hypothetical protein [Cellvibrionaceae bacterium]